MSETSGDGVTAGNAVAQALVALVQQQMGGQLNELAKLLTERETLTKRLAEVNTAIGTAAAAANNVFPGIGDMMMTPAAGFRVPPAAAAAAAAAEPASHGFLPQERLPTGRRRARRSRTNYDVVDAPTDQIYWEDEPAMRYPLFLELFTRMAPVRAGFTVEELVAQLEADGVRHTHTRQPVAAAQIQATLAAGHGLFALVNKRWHTSAKVMRASLLPAAWRPLYDMHRKEVTRRMNYGRNAGDTALPQLQLLEAIREYVLTSPTALTTGEIEAAVRAAGYKFRAMLPWQVISAALRWAHPQVVYNKRDQRWYVSSSQPQVTASSV